MRDERLTAAAVEVAARAVALRARTVANSVVCIHKETGDAATSALIEEVRELADVVEHLAAAVGRVP